MNRIATQSLDIEIRSRFFQPSTANDIHDMGLMSPEPVAERDTDHKLNQRWMIPSSNCKRTTR